MKVAAELYLWYNAAVGDRNLPAGQFGTILSLNKTTEAGLKVRAGAVSASVKIETMKKKILTPRFLAEAGIIAALYFALTMASVPISYMTPQVRLSEALCVLPFFTPAAIPGLFIGCLLSNLAGSPLGPYDILFGSLATLIAAVAARYIRPKWLVPLPAVAVNAFVVAWILQYYLGILYWESVLWVAAGEAIACYALGLPLLLALEKHRDKLFPRR